MLVLELEAEDFPGNRPHFPHSPVVRMAATIQKTK